MSLNRIIKGSKTSFLLQIFSVLQPIVLVPFFIKHWGENQYGRWIIITSIVTYLSLLDLGGQNYIGNRLSFDFIKNRKEKFKTCLSESVSLFLFISLFALLAVFFFLFVILNLPIFINFISFEEKLIILFISSGFLLSIPSGIYVTVYRATGLFSRATAIGIYFKIITLLLSIIALSLSFSPLQYSVVLLSLNIILTIVILIDSRKIIIECKEIKISLLSAKKGIRYLRGALKFWLLSLSIALNQQGIILLIAYYFPPEMVVIYTTHKTVAGIINFIPTTLLPSFWTDLNYMWAEKKKELLKQFIFNSIKFIMFFSGVIALLIWLLLPQIFNLWLGKNTSIQYNIVFILFLQNFLYSGWYTSSWLLLSTNNHSTLTKWALINSITTMVLCFIIVIKFGLLGIVVTSLVCDIFFGAIKYPKLLSNLLSFSANDIYIVFAKVIFYLLPLMFSIYVSKYFILSHFYYSLINISIILLYTFLFVYLNLKKIRREFI